MANTLLVIRGHRSSAVTPHRDKQPLLQQLARTLMGFAGGVANLTSTSLSHGAVEATGTITIATGPGAVGGTINGTLVTVVYATSDTATAAALAVAINAAADIVSKHVVATSALGVVTLTAKYPGHAGNAITLAASGTGTTVSGARLTGGAATLVEHSY